MTNGPTEGAGGLPVAGWYPDPAGSPQERWWGGLNWTENLRDVPVAAPAWPAAGVGMPSPAAPAQPAYKPMGGWNANPDGPGGRLYRPTIGTPNTLPIWFLAVSPVVGFIVIVIGVFSSVPSAYLAIGSTIGALVIVVAAVFWDTAILKERGFPIATPLWLLVGLVGPPLGLIAYLIMRSVALGSGGHKNPAPNVVFGASVLALVGLLYALSTLMQAIRS